MAVKLLGNFVRYIGLSADPKPTIGVPPGSTFYETNTKDIYIYDGTAWSEANATVQTGDTINIGDLEGKDVEGATVTGRPMTIGYKNAAGKATGVSPENALPVQLSGSNVEEIVSSINFLVKKSKALDEKAIFGVKWDKNDNPTLTRTDASVGLVANAGVGFQTVQNDFDYLPIFGEITEVIDESGNVFIRIPKFYIRKMDGVNFKSWQVSKIRYPGFYLPWCFWNFSNNAELSYIDIGKYKASMGGNKLQSIPNVYPISNINIVNMRTYATNNNVDGLDGYQQLDIHVVDVLRTLMIVEFATLNIQSVMMGFTSGRYDANDKAVAATENGNTIIVSNATGANYRVGQTISIHLAGATISTLPNTYGRTITVIEADVPEAGQTTITFDGDPIDVAVNDFMLNTGWKNGFSGQIAASSGCIMANDGKYPCAYRGIESPFGDMWQFVDGVNINESQAWVCKNAAQYTSNVFANPYEKLSYVNAITNNYVKNMGFDATFPFAEFPTEKIPNGETKYYCDYYYRDVGQRIARFGGAWSAGLSAGLSCWSLYSSSSPASVSFGGRLLKKPL